MRRWAVMRKSLGGGRRGSRAALVSGAYRVAPGFAIDVGREGCCQTGSGGPNQEGPGQAGGQGSAPEKTAAAPIPASPARQLLP